MKISKRLLSICELVDKNSIIADIGCDHGQLCVYLIKNKIATKAYACDVKQGPLNQAIENIQLHQLEDVITPILCDGLDSIKEDVTHIVIAGMGFETIKKILEQDIDKIQNRTLFIQSNRDVHKLRTWISERNYKIICEKCIYDDEHYYQIIKWTTTADETLNENQLFLGKNVIEDSHYFDSLENQRQKLVEIIKRIDDTNDKYEMFNKQLHMITDKLGSK